MSRYWLIAAALLVLVAGVSAQEATLVNVYMCYSDGECGHAVTSQEWTPEQAELVIGEPAPSANASIVCVENGACVWTELSESDIELANGGDGTIEPVEIINLDGYPTELLELDFDDIPEPGGDGRVWVVICSGDICRTMRSKITRSEAELIIGEDAPDGDFYILCDEDGCRWQVWDAVLQPADGTWELQTHTPQMRNCPTSGLPLDRLVQFGERTITFSKPARPVDIFVADTGAFDTVREATPSQNSYVLSLGVGSGQFASRIIYDWTVVTETVVVGSVVIDIPSISGGRCIVYIPWEMQHGG